MNARILLGLVFLLGACAASGKMKVGAKSDGDVDGNATFSENPPAAPAAQDASDASAPAPVATIAATGTPEQRAPACPIKCAIANQGPAPEADEQRLAPLLADSFATLHRCNHRRMSTLTLRFDSQAQLTEFGVDDDDTDPGCVDAVRMSRPAVSFAGPSTLRCAEKCGGTVSARRHK